MKASLHPLIKRRFATCQSSKSVRSSAETQVSLESVSFKADLHLHGNATQQMPLQMLFRYVNDYVYMNSRIDVA
jgi:hypothetical protein